MNLDLFNFCGENIGKIEVCSDIFNVEYNDSLIHQVIVSCLSKMRLGTKAQKSRSDVRGGGIKPWRQKGTGRARAGTIRSPLWRGGGVTFAANQRNYLKKINKKMYKKALCVILSELIRSDRLVVVENILFSDCKTKNMINFLSFLKAQNILILLNNIDNNIYLSSRNLFNVFLQKINNMSPVYLIKYDKIIITREALSYLCEVLK